LVCCKRLRRALKRQLLRAGTTQQMLCAAWCFAVVEVKYALKVFLSVRCQMLELRRKATVDKML